MFFFPRGLRAINGFIRGLNQRMGAKRVPVLLNGLLMACPQFLFIKILNTCVCVWFWTRVCVIEHMCVCVWFFLYFFLKSTSLPSFCVSWWCKILNTCVCVSFFLIFSPKRMPWWTCDHSLCEDAMGNRRSHTWNLDPWKTPSSNASSARISADVVDWRGICVSLRINFLSTNCFSTQTMNFDFLHNNPRVFPCI